MKQYKIIPIIYETRIPLNKIEEYEILTFPRWVPRWCLRWLTELKYHRYMKELERISKEIVKNEICG